MSRADILYAVRMAKSYANKNVFISDGNKTNMLRPSPRPKC